MSAVTSTINDKKTVIFDNLKLLSDVTGYPITQRNGQRIFGPPRYLENGPKPERGSEIFVGKLPREIYEDELVPLFQQIGRIYELRLMLDYHGLNRGFCYVTYCNREIAQKAIYAFDGYKIRPLKPISVFESVDNRRLFIGGIGRDKTKEDVKKMISSRVDGVVDVVLYFSQHWNKNRGFAFVDFEDHRTAAVARRELAHNHPKFGLYAVVDWADPLPPLDPAIMSKVANLYVRNLCDCIDTNMIYNFINYLVPKAIIRKIYRSGDYAFINFMDRKQAEIVFQALNGAYIAGHEIEVEWARPKIYSKKFLKKYSPSTSLPSNLCPIMNRRNDQMQISNWSNDDINPNPNSWSNDNNSYHDDSLPFPNPTENNNVKKNLPYKTNPKFQHYLNTSGGNWTDMEKLALDRCIYQF